ncbi:MAG: FHA domain-containing protein [Ignavibacteriales bacterium]|nr:FHA domain-containing protein [Ignavibacteriales bacterium]
MKQYQPSLSRPTGVTILAVLTFIAATLSVIVGLVLLVFGIEFINQVSRFSLLLNIRIGGELIILIALLYIGIGVFEYILANGLLNLKNWARITVIVLTAIQTFFLVIYFVLTIKIMAITAIPFLLCIISLGLAVWVMIYLNTETVRFAFTQNGSGRIQVKDLVTGGGEDGDNGFGKSSRRSFGTLQIIEGAQRGKQFKLVEGKNYVGRDPECSIYLPDPDKYVSRRHAVIVCRDDLIGIVNLSEVGATYVNGEKIIKRKLRGSETIKIGRYIMKIIIFRNF